MTCSILQALLETDTAYEVEAPPGPMLGPIADIWNESFLGEQEGEGGVPISVRLRTTGFAPSSDTVRVFLKEVDRWMGTKAQTRLSCAEEIGRCIVHPAVSSGRRRRLGHRQRISREARGRYR